jgi:hypothetical protein
VSIDVAEIHGRFEGELTARKQLVIYSTGRVSGRIRYGTIRIEEGGELTGDISTLAAAPAQQAEVVQQQAQPEPAPQPKAAPQASPQPAQPAAPKLGLPPQQPAQPQAQAAQPQPAQPAPPKQATVAASSAERPRYEPVRQPGKQPGKSGANAS